MLNFLRRLFGIKPAVVEQVEVSEVEPATPEAKITTRDHYALGGQQDENVYRLRHTSGLQFAGTPAEFAAYYAKIFGGTIRDARRLSVIVYLLGERAKGKEGSRKGWMLAQ